MHNKFSNACILETVYKYIIYFWFYKSHVLTEVWLCPSEGYNALLHGISLKNHIEGKADLESIS